MPDDHAARLAEIRARLAQGAAITETSSDAERAEWAGNLLDHAWLDVRYLLGRLEEVGQARDALATQTMPQLCSDWLLLNHTGDDAPRLDALRGEIVRRIVDRNGVDRLPIVLRFNDSTAMIVEAGVITRRSLVEPGAFDGDA